MSYGPLAVPGKISAFQRRAVVNVRYSSSRTPGGWKAHGTYFERESAKGDGQQKEKQTGLEHDGQCLIPTALAWLVNIRLDHWQTAGSGRGRAHLQDYRFPRRRQG